METHSDKELSLIKRMSNDTFFQEYYEVESAEEARIAFEDVKSSLLANYNVKVCGDFSEENKSYKLFNVDTQEELNYVLALEFKKYFIGSDEVAESYISFEPKARDKMTAAELIEWLEGVPPESYVVIRQALNSSLTYAPAKMAEYDGEFLIE